VHEVQVTSIESALNPNKRNKQQLPIVNNRLNSRYNFLGNLFIKICIIEFPTSSIQPKLAPIRNKFSVVNMVIKAN
jgi:hypothetical protein